MTTTRPSAHSSLPAALAWLIAADGFVTLVACLLAAPIGIGLVLANAIAAVVTHGPRRRAFIVIAIAGTVAVGLVVLLLTGTSGGTSVGPIARL
jgi:hypothetical protein